MFAVDAFAVVGHFDADRLFAHAVAQNDAAALVAVAQRVAHQIVEHHADFFRIAGDFPWRGFQLEPVPVLIQGLEIGENAFHQRRHIDALGAFGRGRGLQARQRDQVIEDGVHVPALLVGPLQRLAGVVVEAVAVFQGFEITGDHGQRGAQFVRGIGGEVAAHGFELAAAGDVVRAEQELVVAIRGDVQAHADRRHVEFQRFAVIPLVQVVAKGGVTNQVVDALADIGAFLQAEKLPRGGVEPLDFHVFVERDGGVGQRLGGFLEALQHLFQALLETGLALVEVVELKIDIFPDTAALWQFLAMRGEAFEQIMQVDEVPDEPGRETTGQPGKRAAQRQSDKQKQRQYQQQADDFFLQRRVHFSEKR